MFSTGNRMQISFRRLLLCPLTVLSLWGNLQGQEARLDAADQAQQLLEERGEVILRFVKPAEIGFDLLTFLSIDNYRNDTVIAYAGREGYNRFLTLRIPFEVLQPPSLHPRRTGPAEKVGDWRSRYPAYAEYETLMEQFSGDHPDLCRLVEFGTSVNGHKLLALEITDNPGISEKEPVVLLSSTMHGNEVTGYVMMLRLIENLLTGYDTVAAIKRLVDSVDIWINPLANPDGAYRLSDLSVDGAVRLNANGIDLNRDFPIPEDPDWENRARQPETQAMMDLMADLRPALAANFHGGAELVNYPWDIWDRLHADNAWYWYISRSYADTVHDHSDSGYMDDMDGGITNGHTWYTVYGGCQDYTNYYVHGRAVTIELSADKMPPDSTLEDYWKYNRNSLLYFINRSLSGITGDITDSITGRPVEASVSIENHDTDNSEILSSPVNGRYYRLTYSGHFVLLIKAKGYQTRRLVVYTLDGNLAHRDIRLKPLEPLAIFPNPFSDQVNLSIDNPGETLRLEFFDLSGRKVKHVSRNVASAGKQSFVIHGLATGAYVVKVTYGSQTAAQILVRLPE
jgi:hypothetical protein